MDKYEFNIKVEQIKKLVNKKDFATAMKIADTIDWRRVRNANLLSMISQVYEKNGEYQEAKEVLLLAFERAPIGKRLLYKLTELALKEGSIEEAEDYYREFCDLAPDDTRQYILRYMILKEKDASVDQMANSLERYLNAELDEKWMYKLAELYGKAGRFDDCIRLCDKMILLFGMGTYVEQAGELKRRYASAGGYQRTPVSPQDMYQGNRASGVDYGTGYGNGGGYGAEAGYGAGNAYGAGAGYGAENAYGAGAGYGTQNAYGAGAGYESQNAYGAGAGYETQNAYGIGAGYGTQNTYGAETGYGTENAYGDRTGLGSENVYGGGTGYEAENSYGAGTSYGPGNAYEAGTGYGTENNAYGAGAGYGTENNAYGAGTGYGTENNSYGAGAGYETENNSYGAGAGYGTENNSYGDRTGYAPGNRYGAGTSYGPENAREAGYETTPYSMDGSYEAGAGRVAYQPENGYGREGVYQPGNGYGTEADNLSGNGYGAGRGNQQAGDYGNGAAYRGNTVYNSGAPYTQGGWQETVEEVPRTYPGAYQSEAFRNDATYLEENGAYGSAQDGSYMEEEENYQQQEGAYIQEDEAYEAGYGSYDQEDSYRYQEQPGRAVIQKIPRAWNGPALVPGVQDVDEELMANLHQAAAEKELAAEMSRISTEDYGEAETPAHRTRVFRGKNNIRTFIPREEEETPYYERSYIPHHFMVEAKTPDKGFEIAVKSLKEIHQQTGVNNQVIKITGGKLSKRGVFNVSDKLAGKDLIIEEAGDLAQIDLEQLQVLMERDETGMIVVLIDNPLQLKELRQKNPGFSNLFKSASDEDETAKSVKHVSEQQVYEEAAQQTDEEEAAVKESAQQEQGAVDYKAETSKTDEETKEYAESENKSGTSRLLKTDIQETVYDKEQTDGSQEDSEEGDQEGEYADEEYSEDGTEEGEYTDEEYPEDDDEEDEYIGEEYSGDEGDEYTDDEYSEDGDDEDEYADEEYPEDGDEEGEYTDGECSEIDDDEYTEDEYLEDENSEEEYAGEEGDNGQDEIDDEELSVNAFAEYAAQYASEIDCSITGKSMLALYEKIEAMEEDGIPLTRANAEELIEEAADKAEKPSLGGLIKGVFSSKYDKDGLLILKEEHFI